MPRDFLYERLEGHFKSHVRICLHFIIVRSGKQRDDGLIIRKSSDYIDNFAEMRVNIWDYFFVGVLKEGVAKTFIVQSVLLGAYHAQYCYNVLIL